MNVFNETRQETEKKRFLTLFLLIGVCCLLTFYSGLVLNTTSVYTHLFYIPIFLASLWWERRGITVVLFLSLFLLTAYVFFTGCDISYYDYLRVGVFSFVGLFLSLSMNRTFPERKIVSLNSFIDLKSVLLKDSSKIAFITVLVFLSCFMTVYFHVVENRGTVFSHFFYIPIILSAIWWKRRGLIVALILSSFLLFGHFLLRDYVITINDYLRAVMFIVVPLCVSFLGEKVSIAESRVSFLDLVLKMVHNVNRLIMQEIDKQRLAEGIAEVIAENPECLYVKINLFNEKGEPEEEIIRCSPYGAENCPASNSVLTSCQEKALNRITPFLSMCDECGECNNKKSVSFSYSLEYEGFEHGVISVIMSGNDIRNSEMNQMLKSISDELAYALYNLGIDEKRKQIEEALRLDESRIKTISDFSKISDSSFEEMTLFALKEALRLSKSETGYIAFINEEMGCVEVVSIRAGRNLSVNSINDKRIYDLYDAGMVPAVMRSFRPFVTEDRDELKKIGYIYEESDLRLKRHIDIPVLESGKVLAVIGLGNRQASYGQVEVKNISLLMQGMWTILQHRKDEEELALYREKLRDMVKARTSELEYANSRLTVELGEKNILYKNLEESSRELESFVHTVSHDLKSPLFSMKLCVDMLNKAYTEDLDPECLELLKQIKKENFRMEELIKDILTLSRVGMEYDNSDEIDILKLLLDVLKSFEYLIEENSIEYVLRITVPEPLPAVRANRSQVVQVFENLLTNAVKFMGSQPEPCVVVGFDAVENNFCRFYVEDNGIGIAEDKHESIFSEFYRIRDVDVEGTGIGLAIVKKVVEKHGGQISLSSEPGEGSTFYFSFPANISES